jgi:5-methylcytosine-specific restriction endonuclease McrA
MKERKNTYYLPNFILPLVKEPPIGYREKSRFSIAGKNRKYFDLDGDPVKINSIRLFTFQQKGIKCSFCGVEGKFFVKERNLGSKLEKFHLELYGIDHEGKEILMTKDHIFPVVKGGKDNIENLQTACEKCNSKKGDQIL